MTLCAGSSLIENVLLSFLIRKASSYFSLPKDIKDRLKALKVLHRQRAAIQMEYQKELYALEFKYAKLYATTYQQVS